MKMHMINFPNCSNLVRSIKTFNCQLNQADLNSTVLLRKSSRYVSFNQIVACLIGSN